MNNRGPFGRLTNSPLVDDGTLIRTASRTPGTTGRGDHTRAKKIALALENSMGFSDHAVERMKYLESPAQAKKMVGSNSGIAASPELVTNCITYVISVLSYGFEKSNQLIAAKKVRSLGTYGTELAKYLVKLGWTAAYCNPDVHHPADGDDEHIASYRTVKVRKKYYEIPVKYAVVNYNPTARSNPYYQNHWGMSKEETKKDTGLLDVLAKVKFGYGLSRGGRHTWLYSYGRVYEVHWDQVGVNLYDSKPLETYEWLSSAIVFPPDTAAERLQDLY